MSNINPPRLGATLVINDGDLPFSFWPTLPNVFVTNPWALIAGRVKSDCPLGAQPEALATIEQAEALFRAAQDAATWAAKPLLTYYSFLNLGKALALTRGQRPNFDQTQHGITEQRDGQRQELVDSYIRAFQSPNSRNGELQGFDEFYRVINGTGLAAVMDFRVPHVLSQIITGHRLWCSATGNRERFIAVDSISFKHNTSKQEVWLEMCISRHRLGNLSVTPDQLITEARLSEWHEVRSQNQRDVILEHKVVMHYKNEPLEIIQNLANGMRKTLWATATIMRPYRRYYLYLCPSGEEPEVLPQLLSTYLMFYYFGSLTRYRPQQFNVLLDGKYGEIIQEFLSNQPNQFLYLISSEFARREVTKAGIV